MESSRLSLQRFAAVSAALAHPFAARATTLSSYGLDEAAWASIRDDWRSRLGEDVELARTFAHLYTVERQQTRRPPAPASQFAVENAPPPPTGPQGAAQLGDMTALPVSRGMAVVPFSPRDPTETMARLPAGAQTEHERRTPDDLDGTQQLSLDDTSLTLPFLKPLK